jgi:hypothetical protein
VTGLFQPSLDFPYYWIAIPVVAQTGDCRSGENYARTRITVLLQQLDVIAGAVLSEPRVTGDAVRLGSVRSIQSLFPRVNSI